MLHRQLSKSSFTGGNAKLMTTNVSHAQATLLSADQQARTATNKMVLLYFLRKEKKNHETNEAPLYLRIIVAKERTEISLNRKVKIDKWNPDKQIVVGSKEESKELNDYLNAITYRLNQAQRLFLEREETITAKALKEFVFFNQEHKRTLVNVFEGYITSMLAKVKPNVSNGFSLSTIKKYQYCRNHIKNFLYLKWQIEDISLSKVDVAFVQAFEDYLLNAYDFKDSQGKLIHKMKNDNNAKVKNIQILGRIIKESLSHGWIKTNPLVNIKARYNKVDQVFLTEDEVISISRKEISIERLNTIRDIYVFCCYTGLAYSDVQKLKPSDITFGIEGIQYIKLTRTKTGTQCTIPLLPPALEIIEKYKSNLYCSIKGVILPVPSNQKFNAYLKELGTICNIDKNLTSHSARRAFGEIAMNNDIPAETIIKIIGHSNYGQLHKYARTSEKKIARDIQPLIVKYLNPVLSLTS